MPIRSAAAAMVIVQDTVNTCFDNTCSCIVDGWKILHDPEMLDRDGVRPVRTLRLSEIDLVFRIFDFLRKEKSISEK